MLARSSHKPIDVLMIEDNPGDVRLLEEAFQELNSDVRVQVARDGAEGLKMVRDSSAPESRWHPDLILLDLNLPKVNGHQVLTELKSDPQTTRIPVIVLTSSRAESDVRRAYQAHANAYLKKPSTLDGLLSAAQDITNFWIKTATLPGH